MGRMKEIFMEQRQQFNQSDEEKQHLEYLKWYYETRKDVPVDMTMACPNCFEKKLEYLDMNNIECTGCGQEFILVDANTLRFK